MTEQQNGDGQEVQVVVPDVEAPPEASGLIVANEAKTKELQYLSENIEKMVEFHVKIRTAILKVAQPGDWSLWGKEGAQRAELGFSGANRISAMLGVNYSNWSAEKVIGTDEIGDWYRWEYQCDASYSGRTIRVYGRAGSRDKFFGFEDKQWKQLSNVNEGNVKICAMRAAKKEGIKDLFGLHGLDPEFMKTNGIKLESAGGYSHKGKNEQMGELQTVNVAIDEVTFKKTDKWTKYTVKDGEGVAYQTFSETMATEAKRVMTEKTVAKIDFAIDPKWGPQLVSINGIVSEKKG